jgi:sodium transport system permease protein
MRELWSVARKEFARFFGDRRMVLTALVLPGLMIYLVYSFMGSALTQMFAPDADYVPVACVMDAPASLSASLSAAGLASEPYDKTSVEEMKAGIAAKEADLLVVFPADFDALVTARTQTPGQSGAAVQVEIYYNSSAADSSALYERVSALLEEYEASLANLFDVNRGGGPFDLASREDAAGMLFASMLPMLLLIFMFSGCMAVAPEAIAGEKERGTIATILVTPLRRGALAMGKLLSLSAIAFLVGLSSLLGTVLSLPKMLAGGDAPLSMDIYGAGDYLSLALVILSTVLLFIAVISILSAFAKTVKEAATLVSPLMAVVMLVGVTAMFGGGGRAEGWVYLIPVYNSVQAMSGIFALTADPANILTAGLSNLVCAALGGFTLTRMFGSEKIIFGK